LIHSPPPGDTAEQKRKGKGGEGKKILYLPKAPRCRRGGREKRKKKAHSPLCSLIQENQSKRPGHRRRRERGGERVGKKGEEPRKGGKKKGKKKGGCHRPFRASIVPEGEKKGKKEKQIRTLPPSVSILQTQCSAK